MLKSSLSRLLLVSFLSFCMPVFNVNANDNIYEFSYTGNYQEFVVPYNGIYQVELWGASGGKNLYQNSTTSAYSLLGGSGAYTSGELFLKKGSKIYIYVGGKGANGAKSTIVAGGYNGGGTGDYDHSDDEAAGAGGGATDIRLTPGEWDDFDSLKSRIMVAGAGGGSTNGLAGGYGGALEGRNTLYGVGGTQTSGYKFGVGQDGVYKNSNVEVAGGGSGYFGGTSNSSGKTDSYKASGAGGSSFVSGCDGCVAIDEKSTEDNIIFTDQNIHYSNYIFENIVMKAGSEEVPSFDGTTTMTGNSNNDGYAKITFLKEDERLGNLEIENAILIPEFDIEELDYDVIIPYNSDTLNTNISYEVSNMASILGVGSVILEKDTTHTITLTSNSGMIYVYNLNIIKEKASFIDLSFEEAKIDFNSHVYQYSLEVPYSIKKLTPQINASSDIKYNIIGNDLKVGSNTVQIEVSRPGYENGVYEIEVTRADYQEQEIMVTPYTFSVVNDYQIFTVPKTGIYKIELWGASGGKNMSEGAYTNSYIRAGGKGAYTSGEILLAKGTDLYVYVGGMGQNALNAKDTPGGYNGGGNGTHDHADNESSGAGGGATDIRLVAGNWSDFDSLKSRIMVAAGGGGASYNQAGGYGGALEGENSPYAAGGTQTTGYKFGMGQSAVFENSNVDVAGGGSGYFGGGSKSSGSASVYLASGAGGSSFVSGCDGCVAIHPTSTQNKMLFLDSGIHYSDYQFDNIIMKAGNEEMPTFDGQAVMTGNTGDGYAQITFIRDMPLLYDLEIENATLMQGVTEDRFVYDVVIPSSPFSTDISYLATDNDLLVLGVKDVTLKHNTPHYISLTDYQTGEVVIYTLNPTLEKPTAESIKFSEIEFEFKKTQYKYNFEVDYSISEITPTVIVESNKNYQLLSSTKLSVGSNIFEVEVSNQNNQKEIYQFVITRLPFENPVSEIPFTGSYQEWTAPLDGYYNMELWGAAGGRGRTNYTLNKMGGNGSYTSGTIYLTKGTTFYVYVGGQGKNSASVSKYVGGLGGYNGGAQGGIDGNRDSAPEPGAGGGGATDIRTTIAEDGLWSDSESLKSRIMVAGAGGGGSYSYVGAAGGGLNGYPGLSTANYATQISGGGFGTTVMVSSSSYSTGPGGSGSGYYGGVHIVSDGAVGGGGSSFISGHAGCIAVLEDGTPKTTIYTQLDDSIHYSNYKFEDTVMIDGKGYQWTTEIGEVAVGMPAFDGTGTVNGNSSNGHARITYLGNTKSTNLDSLSVSSGNLDPIFSEDTYEYNLVLDSMVSSLDVYATSTNTNVYIRGTGNYEIPSGDSEIVVSVTAPSGEIKLYTINVTREASNYKYLDDVSINGIPYSEFDKNVYEYNIELDATTQYIDLQAVKGMPSQTITGDGKVLFDTNERTLTLLVVSEDKSQSQHYTFNFTRQKSTKLRLIDLNTDLVTGFEFSPNILNYQLEMPVSVLELAIEAIPFYVGANVEITGHRYLEEGGGTITLTVKLDGLDDTVYQIQYTKKTLIEEPVSLYYHTGEEQTFTALYSGVYRIELWGAAGGQGRRDYKLTYLGGSGGYTSGDIILQEEQKLYLHVGGKGKNGASVSKCVGGVGGYNGGAQGGNDGNCDSAPEPGGGGGGATDVRLVSGLWNDTESLKSRIMVAGAGSGSSYTSKGIAAGGLKSYLGSRSTVATQTSGGGFGTTVFVTSSSFSSGTGGAGSGYYGGSTARVSAALGSGGSSFISGHAGSIAILEDGTHKNTTYTTLEDSYHYSNFVFKNTKMIDGAGYGWTTVKNGLELMPNPLGGYYASGAGNFDDGYAKITLLSVVSNDNFLDSLTINDGDVPLDFEPWITDYQVVLGEKDVTVKIDATPKDSTATITGLGVIDVPPGDSQHLITVTAQDGSIKTYTLNIYRPGSSDQHPLNIEILGMQQHLCEFDSSYCNYSFNENTTNYEIFLPFSIRDLEIKTTLQSKYQTLIYRKIEDSSELEVENGLIRIDGESVVYEVEVISEDKSQNIIYTYTFRRDMTGNNNLRSITITNPEILFDFDPYTYEYYVSISSEYDTYDIEAIPDNPDAEVEIKRAESLVFGMNDCMIIVTAPNGDTKTYIVHVYKEKNSNVFLQKLEVSSSGSILELTPTFNKLLNDYTLTVGPSIKEIDITALSESTTAIIVGDGNKKLVSGMNNFEILVTSESGDTNLYTLDIFKEKNNDPTLSSIEIEGYPFDEEFNPNITEYYVEIPKDITSVNVLVTPKEETTTYSIYGNLNLNKATNVITVTAQAEDGTEKKYIIHVTKPLSSNNYLQNIVLDNGSLNETFDKETVNYTVNVENDITEINVTGVLDDDTARIIGNGTYYLTTGSNIINLIVTSETDEERVYTITVNRNKNDDVTLKEVKNNANSEVVETDEVDYQYLINVQYEVNEIEIQGIANSSSSTVSGNGKYSLVVGNNDIILSVTSESGTIKTYTVRVVRDLSTNDDLKYLFVHEGGLSPRFKNTNILYEVKVPNSTTNLTFDIETEDPNASYEIIGNDTELEVSKEKEIIVRVTAPKGNTKDYTLMVTRQEATTNDLTLQSLTVDSGTLTPVFDKNTYIYQVEVEHDVDEITLTGVATDSNNVVLGNGTYELWVGKNPLSIFVVGPDDVQQDYQVVVTRKASPDASLSNLVVKGSSLSPKFNKNTTEYILTTSNSSLEFTTIQPTEADSTYEIIGNSDFVTGENTVTIIVTAPDKVTTKSYTLFVTKEGNSNNNLASLEVVGHNLTPTFHKGVTTYSVNVNNNVNNVVIRAVPEVSTSVVTNEGSHQIDVGTNIIEVSVTSEAGTIKKYTIIVTKDGSTNDYLSDLYVSSGDLTPEFDKETLEYSVEVENDVDSIEIMGTLEDMNSTVSGLGTYDLQVGDNDFLIIVTSEAGSVRNYRVVVNRKEKISSYLKALEVKDYELTPTFNKETFEYYITVNNETTNLDITALAEDDNAQVAILGNNNLVVGMNEININVTATDQTMSTYKLYVNRNLSTNNYLSSIRLSSGTLEPEFNKEVLEYNINLDNNIDSIDVLAIAEDDQSIVTLGNGTHKLVTGENIILIKVKSAVGIYRTYKLKITREQSDNNYLSNLSIKDGTTLLPFNEIFVKTNNHYTKNIDSSINYIIIEATPEDSNATVLGIGTKKLTTGVNTFDVIVTSESGISNVYQIDLTKLQSSNSKATMITPSTGNLDKNFDPDIKNYILSVSTDDSLLSFDVIPEDSKSVIRGHQNEIIPNGISERVITIEAEDKSITSYTFKIIKENSGEARLSSLKIKGYEINFDKDTFSYNLSVSAGKSKLLESEIEAIAIDDQAQINLMGDLTLIDNITNTYTIEVIARDGYTIQEYKINITKDNEDYTLRSNVYEIVRDKAYVIGSQPNLNVSDYISNFENDPSMLAVYNLENVKLDDQQSLVGTSMVIRLEKDGVVYDSLKIIVRGDITKDGKVDLTDQIRLVSYVGKNVIFDDDQILAADLTKDSIVNLNDQIKLVNYVGKTITDLND